MNKLTTKINVLYFSTLLVLVITVTISWQTLFIPFVEKNEQVKADLLLSPYASIFEQLIDDKYYDDLDIIISTLMLLKDEDNQQPLILSLKITLNDDKVIEHKNEDRDSHFVNKIPLFSPSTFELVGSLEIKYNDYTYQQIIGNSNKVLMIVMAIFILLFVLGQRLLSRIVYPLTSLSEVLSNVDSMNIEEFPIQDRGLSTEIRNVWSATKIMLDRIRKREIELQDKHEVAQQALVDKLEAESANKTKSMFLANMSHEIRTPLTAIIGFAEVLRDDGMMPAKKESARRTIVRNGKHLLSVINDILDLSKIESNKLDIEEVEISFLQLINDVESVFEPQFKEKDLDFIVNYQFPLPKIVVSDPTRVRQILFNLLSNSSKFTERGSVSLTVKFDDQKECIQISVKDTGIGLSTDQMNKVFSPFSQADVSTTRKFGGTGLGLTISRRLARMLGGDLKVYSKEGEGSEFILTFKTGHVTEMYSKISQYQSDSVAKVPEIDVTLLSGNILIAEDTKDIQDLLAYYLDHKYVEITFANNGEEAVELAIKNNYDLILMDIQMPLLDGLGATKKLREQKFTKPIIALTANVMQEDRERYAAEGMVDFIAKPINQKRLYQVLEQYLPKCAHTDVTEKEERQVKRQKTSENLANKFKQRLPKWLEDIANAVKESDQDALSRSSHVLKGLGGSFGFPEITMLSEKIESCAMQADFTKAAEYFSELEVFCKNNV